MRESRTCKNCGAIFQPKNNEHLYCHPDCKKRAKLRAQGSRYRSTSPKVFGGKGDFFPTESGVAGIETLSADYCPLG